MRTIYRNGRVYTGGPALAGAFAVEDGRFVFAGEDREAEALISPGDRVIDLAGRFVCPGFNDSHMHLLNFGSTARAARLADHTHSLAAVLDCMRQALAEPPPREGGWLTGRGWNQDYFTDADRMPHRWDLDTVSTEVPILITRACGHSLVVNSRALELLGVTADTPSPPGGRIGLENGVPDGRFYDGAMSLVYDAMPPPGKEEIKEMLRTGAKLLNSYGITSCHSDDYSAFRTVPWQVVNEAYRELEESGELTVRVCEQCNFTDLGSFRDFVEAGNVSGTGSEMFRIGPLKLLGDGSLGARTAYLSRPYEDDPSARGLVLFSQEEFDGLIGYAHEHGMHTAVHAIGDGTLDRVLSAVEKALAAHPRKDHRHGIVHCQITRPDQLRRMIELGMHIYAQSIFLDYDTHIVERLVGPERAASSYSWKTLLEGGLTVSNGSDCPVELPFALGGIQCAVTRQDLAATAEPYLPEQAFTVREALDSYTAASARASFEENVKGRIAPGMLADFTVLGEDPFETNAHRIKDIPVVSVFLGGRRVYGEAL